MGTGASSGWVEDASAGRWQVARLVPDQLPEDGKNPFKLGGLIEKEIRAGSHALFAILRIRIVRANQDLKIRIVGANSTKHVKTAAAGHLEIENKGVGLHRADGLHRFGHASSLTHKLRSRDLLQQVRQALDDSANVQTCQRQFA